MYELFSKFSSDYRAAFSKAMELAGTKQATVSIGWLEGWDMSLFYGQMTDYFAVRHPDITLELEGYSFADMMPAMKRGKADLLISLGSSLRDYSELETAELTTTGGIILLSREHPLASKPDLAWEDFKDETFLSINEPDGKRNTSGFTRQECLRHGFEPEVLNVPSVSNAFLRMQSNNCVFFVDDWLAIKSSPLLRYIEVDSVFDIAIGWLPTADEATKLVASELINFFRNKFEPKT
jgi:DNA-binding transcriptional LysR family regulator